MDPDLETSHLGQQGPLQHTGQPGQQGSSQMGTASQKAHMANSSMLTSRVSMVQTECSNGSRPSNVSSGPTWPPATCRPTGPAWSRPECSNGSRPSIVSAWFRLECSSGSRPNKVSSGPTGPPATCQIHHAITQTTEHPTTVARHYNTRSRHTVALKPNHTEGAQSLQMFIVQSSLFDEIIIKKLSFLCGICNY